MCMMNMLCQVTDGTCSCSKILPTSSLNLLQMSQLMSIIYQQNTYLLSIKSDLQKAMDQADYLSSARKNLEVPSEHVSSLDIVDYICKPGLYKYQLTLEDKLIFPLYKERNFSLNLSISDLYGNKVKLCNPEKFHLGLYTAENPPKPVTHNTSGSNVLRGTIETFANSEIGFFKVCINEVSSHFRNGVFSLVVMPESGSQVKPLVIQNVVVKARKINPCATKKILKASE